MKYVFWFSMLFAVGCMTIEPADRLQVELAKHQHLPPFKIDTFFKQYKAEKLEKLAIKFEDGASWSLTRENGLMYQPGPKYHDVFGKTKAVLTGDNSFCTEAGAYGKLFISGEPKLRFSERCLYLFGTENDLIAVRQKDDGEIKTRKAAFFAE